MHIHKCVQDLGKGKDGGGCAETCGRSPRAVGVSPGPRPGRRAHAQGQGREADQSCRYSVTCGVWNPESGQSPDTHAKWHRDRGQGRAQPARGKSAQLEREAAGPSLESEPGTSPAGLMLALKSPWPHQETGVRNTSCRSSCRGSVVNEPDEHP